MNNCVGKVVERQCPVCHSNGRDLGERREPNPSLYGEHEIRTLYRGCERCGMHFYDLIEGLNDRGQIYEVDSFHVQTPHERHRMLAKLVRICSKHARRGLEIGAGQGFPSKMLADTGVLMYLMDKYPDAKSDGKTHYLHDDLNEPDERPELVNSLDFVLADNILEHLPSVNPIVEKSARWLKDGGYFFVVVPNRLDIRAILSRRFARNSSRPVEHVNEFDDRTLNRLMSRYGLRRARCWFVPRTLREILALISINFVSIAGIYKIYRKPLGH